MSSDCSPACNVTFENTQMEHRLTTGRIELESKDYCHIEHIEHIEQSAGIWNQNIALLCSACYEKTTCIILLSNSNGYVTA